MTKTPYIN